MPLSNPVVSSLSKSKAESRVNTAASGDVAYTGYGFQPTSLIILARGSAGGGSIGMTIPAGEDQYLNADGYDTELIKVDEGGGLKQQAVLKQYDADGFTLTWTKLGLPTGTTTLFVQAFS